MMRHLPPLPQPQPQLQPQQTGQPIDQPAAQPTGQSANPRGQAGYTLQSLIMITILMLVSVAAFTILYGIFQDANQNVAGESQNFTGLPTPPQDLQVTAVPAASGAANAIDLTVSWNSPTSFGENAFIRYLPAFQRAGASTSAVPNHDAGTYNNFTCDFRLDFQPPGVPAPARPAYIRHKALTETVDGTEVTVTETDAQRDARNIFNYSNSCTWSGVADDTNTPRNMDGTAQLRLIVETGNSAADGQAGSDTARHTFNYDLNLSRDIDLQPLNVETDSTPSTIRVSWEPPASSTDRASIGAYLLRIPELEYYLYLCTGGAADDGPYVQNVPDFSGRDNVVQSSSETYPQAGVTYQIQLSSRTAAELPADCADADAPDDDSELIFQDLTQVSVTGSLGAPNPPQISVAPTMTDFSISGRTVPAQLPLVTVSSPDCADGQLEDGSYFTFFWSEQNRPSVQDQTRLEACSGTLPIGAIGEVTTEIRRYRIWATETSSLGTSIESEAVSWESSGTPAPLPPENVRARWTVEQDGYTQAGTDPAVADLTYSVSFMWDAPNQQNFEISEYHYHIGLGSATCFDDSGSITTTSVPSSILSVPDMPMEITTNPDLVCFSVRSAGSILVNNTLETRESNFVRIYTTLPALALDLSSNLPSATWDASDSTEISGFAATVSSVEECPVGNTLVSEVFKVTPEGPVEPIQLGADMLRPNVDPSGAGTYSFELEPPFDGGDGSEPFASNLFLCLTAQYRDGSTHTFFNSPAWGVMPMPDPMTPVPPMP